MTTGRRARPVSPTDGFSLFQSPPRGTALMIWQVVTRVANWDQLERIWAFIVGFFKFLWALLRFLGGGG
jgi:hypothetical protein